MERQYTSPTLGEVVKYAVAASGVMPRKAHDRHDLTEFDQGMAKTYQKRMQRLAKEDCHLQSALGDIAQLLTNSLGRYVRCPFRANQIRELLNELYASYASMIKQMGTFMTKSDTARYFLTTYAIEIAVRSAARTWVLLQGYIYAAPQPLEPCWYLPSGIDGENSTPLSKVMAWAYASCGCSLASFHDPVGVKDESGLYERNERAARSWKAGRHLPSLPALVKNLEESFLAQASVGQPVEQRLQDGIVTCAAIARITTCIAQDIQEAMGKDYLKDVLSQIHLYSGWMAMEVNEYMGNLNQCLNEQSSHSEINTQGEESFRFESQAQANAKKRVVLGLNMAPVFWERFEGKRQNAQDLLLQHRDANGYVPAEVVQWIERRYGPFAARISSDVISRRKLDKPSQFDRYLQQGLAMRNGSGVTLHEVDKLSEDMTAAGVAVRLPWLVHWLRGIVFYRSGDFATASIHYTEAFKLAKYSAGELQYLLVNQYLEVMAKTKQWLPFKQGALWASYLDISVRWLRDKEPTDENIRCAFGFLGLQQGRYASL
nr:hypothetical protein [uncultured Pseudomonas sp.]